MHAVPFVVEWWVHGLEVDPDNIAGAGDPGANTTATHAGQRSVGKHARRTLASLMARQCRLVVDSTTFPPACRGLFAGEFHIDAAIAAWFGAIEVEDLSTDGIRLNLSVRVTLPLEKPSAAGAFLQLLNCNWRSVWSGIRLVGEGFRGDEPPACMEYGLTVLPDRTAGISNSRTFRFNRRLAWSLDDIEVHSRDASQGTNG